MNKDKISEAKARASEVIDGFRLPNQQIARDVMNLVDALETAGREMDALKKRIAGIDNISKIFGKMECHDEK